MEMEKEKEKENKHHIIKKDEIQLNVKSIPLIILCIIIAVLLGNFRGYIMLLKPNFFYNIIAFIVSLIALIYCVLGTKKILVIFFLLTTIAFLVNIFHPLF